MWVVFDYAEATWSKMIPYSLQHSISSSLSLSLLSSDSLHSPLTLISWSSLHFTLFSSLHTTLHSQSFVSTPLSSPLITYPPFPLHSLRLFYLASLRTKFKTCMLKKFFEEKIIFFKTKPFSKNCNSTGLQASLLDKATFAEPEIDKRACFFLIWHRSGHAAHVCNSGKASKVKRVGHQTKQDQPAPSRKSQSATKSIEKQQLSKWKAIQQRSCQSDHSVF